MVNGIEIPMAVQNKRPLFRLKMRDSIAHPTEAPTTKAKRHRGNQDDKNGIKFKARAVSYHIPICMLKMSIGTKHSEITMRYPLRALSTEITIKTSAWRQIERHKQAMKVLVL